MNAPERSRRGTNPFRVRIDAVVFDMDGTLHDTEAVYHRSLKEAVEAVGYAVTDAFCHSLIGIPGPESDAMLRTHFGDAFPYADYDQQYRSRCDLYLAAAVPLKPGAAEILAMLRASGIRTAVATSASRYSAERHLARSGLRPHFEAVVTRDDVKRAKPHPDPFLRAAELLGVSPGSCVAVEDSFHGIRAAHAAGMVPVMVPDLLAPTEEIQSLCGHIAYDLHDLRELIAEHLAAAP